MIEIDVLIKYELFSAKGTIIKEKNYLDVFIYERQSENYLPRFEKGELVNIQDCFVEEGITTVFFSFFI